MAQSGRFYLDVRKVAAITIAWTILRLIDTFNSDLIIRNVGISLKVDRLLVYFHLGMFVSTVLAGIISGSILVFYLRKRLNRMPFGLALMTNSAVISLINFAITALTLLVVFRLLPEDILADLDRPLQYESLVNEVFLFRNLIFWAIVALVTLFALNIDEKYGPGIFLKLIRGVYHRPRTEERIFMFLDIKGSTTFAEQMGHLRFHSLLNDFFRDITNPILDSSGEIYQYVGDMVVVTWTVKRGLRQANCIRCFYHIRETMLKKAHIYRARYGLVPDFKAGLHCGPVTTGEIGLIKKDIVYSGDVLNTTARIQGMCNKFRVRILLSKYLLDKLHLPPGEYNPERLGMIELKGKRQKVELYTFQEHVVIEEKPLSNSWQG